MKRDYPPLRGNAAHLGNWREAPHSAWAFHHVRELIPTAMIARAESFTALPNAPADVQGLSFARPDGGRSTVAEFFSETAGDGMIVLKNGANAAEWYRAPFRPRDPHLVFSVSKSLTALVAGILEDQGKLDPQAPVSEYVPEVAGSAYASARVRHVLDMTVGIDFEEVYLKPGSPFARYREATGWNPPDPAHPLDLRSFLMTLPPDGKAHGEQFHYVSPNSDLLGFILERAAAENFAPLFERLIWQPMGAEFDASIAVDKFGAPRTAGGISVSLRDLARVGEMMRQGGKACGRQIVPARFVEELYSKGERGPWLKGDLLMLAPQGHYRNKWYVRGAEGAMMAVGIHGQWLYVDPRSGVTIVKVSAQPLPVDDAADQLHLAAFEAICASLA